MLYVVPVADDQRDTILAVTHVDGTARLQVVHDETTRYHKLISAFGDATGLSVILNTSFNLRGQPIVNSSRDAWGTFNESGLDLLVLDRFIAQRP